MWNNYQVVSFGLIFLFVHIICVILWASFIFAFPWSWYCSYWFFFPFHLVLYLFSYASSFDFFTKKIVCFFFILLLPFLESFHVVVRLFCFIFILVFYFSKIKCQILPIWFATSDRYFFKFLATYVLRDSVFCCKSMLFALSFDSLLVF